ncbi:MAG: integration host factor subunit beta [Planctomycetia bacterium]|nr:integration host factor subunit beta [Planctomycetia bacterium]
MTKKELSQAIAQATGLSVLQTQEIVQKTIDAIVKALLVERRIELRGFGVFEVTKRAARKARNPRTGEKLVVPAKLVVTFTPGKEMKKRIQRISEGQPKTSDAA